MQERGDEKIRACAEKLTLEFQHLCYAVTEKGKRKEVLHSISGQILPGHLTAILGPSGAGKTSFLNVLTGFKTNGVSGSVLINGAPRDMARFRTQACYIPQESSLLGQLTTRDTLTIAARLKLTSPSEVKRQAVNDVMDLLGLTKCKDTRVSQLSGGEKKRLSIGVELITNPPIMFFDEPTSGLDTVSSAQILNHLSNLASSGHAVVCVVHQPSSQLCELFDDVIVLAEGEILYCGSMAEMIPAFGEAGFQCPQYYNRADFALEVACGGRGKDFSALLKRSKLPETDLDNNTQDPTEHTNMLPIKQSLKNPIITQMNGVAYKTVNDTAMTARARYPISALSQFWILFWRSLLCNVKDMHLTHVRIVCHLLVGVLLGVIYYDIGNEASKINSNIAAVFFMVMFIFYMNGLPIVLSFPYELAVVIREHLNNWYSITPYYFSHIMALIPMQLICPTLFIGIAYTMTGQPVDGFRMGWVVLIMVMLVSLAQAIALTIGSLVEPRLGLIGIPVTTIPMMLFSGFFLRIPDIPIYLRWMGYISYYRHAFEAIVTTLYGNSRPNLTCSQPYCHFKSPHKFIQHLDMHEDNFNTNIIVLLVWIVFMHSALYVTLRWKIYMAKK